MDVKKIDSLHAAQARFQDAYRKQAREPRAPESRSLPIPKDSVEISGDARQRRLELIRERVHSGFYRSTSVTDDLSDKLSKVMDTLS